MRYGISTLLKQKDIIIYVQAIRILTVKDRVKYLLLLSAQILLAFLELFTLASAGVIAAITVSGFAQNAPDSRISSVLQTIGISELSVQTQATILAAILIASLLGKTILSLFLLNKTTKFLGMRGVKVATERLTDIYSRPVDFIEKFQEQSLLYSLTTGIERITFGILASLSQLVVDASLIIVVFMGLFFINPGVLLISIILFSGIAAIYYFAANDKLHQIGKAERAAIVKTDSSLLELLRSYRENVLGATSKSKIDTWGSQRREIVNLTAKRIFLAGFGRYIIEVSVVLGSLVVAAIQFLLYDATKAAAITGIFFMASTRISPAIIRIQQELMKMKYSVGSSDSTISLLEDLRLTKELSWEKERSTEYGNQKEESSLEPTISISNLSYSHFGSKVPIFKDLTIELHSGKKIGIIGPSGAGKSTLVDLILGIRTPSSGKVKIGGYEPRSLHEQFPNTVAYIPQQIPILSESIRDNLLLGSSHSVSDEDIYLSLRAASLESWVESQPFGLDSLIRDRGVNLSGGQRQRLGIARALLSKPMMLIMDESTSSVDAETEERIAKRLVISENLKTILIVAHRFTTIKDCDQFLYVGDGEVILLDSIYELKRLGRVKGFVKDFLAVNESSA